MTRPLACLCIVSVLLTLAAAAVAADAPRGVVYDFTATWCGPCQQVAPVVSKLEREGLPIRKVDIDQQRDMADRYRIQGVPTFVLVIDGKEADRHVGPMTESDLRRMIGRIPSSPAPAPNVAGTRDIPVHLGEPTRFPAANVLPVSSSNAVQSEGEPVWNSTSQGIERPEPEPLQQEIRVAENESPSGIRRLWPFGRPPEDGQPTVRGNDSGLAANAGTLEAAGAEIDPMAASVRIRVIIDGQINLGSGTIISSRPGLTRILTCGHIFRKFNEDSKIEVDWFEEGRHRMAVARLVKFDLDADVGLITLPSDVILPTVKVATAAALPQIGEPVVSIGCSGGDDPTREQVRVTAIDKYDGPNNLECTGLPVQGRSGGGLFNNSGELVGVCFAADKKGQRGLYAGLLALHQLLDECQLTDLYQPPAPAVAAAPAPVVRHEPSAPVAANAPHSGSAAASMPAAVPSEPVDVRAGNAEVVVILRDKSQPLAPNRVVIIHQASPKFLAYLSGELDAMPSRPLSQSSPEPLNATVRALRTVAEPLAATERSLQPVSEKGLLIPTALSQPAVPRPYVRSRESRNSSSRENSFDSPVRSAYPQ